jgi:hypothetical protein
MVWGSYTTAWGSLTIFVSYYVAAIGKLLLILLAGSTPYFLVTTLNHPVDSLFSESVLKLKTGYVVLIVVAASTCWADL